MKPDADGREVWWISSPEYGVRIAWFVPMLSLENPWAVMILGEPPERTGIRDWKDVQVRERWIKVSQINVPDANDIAIADYIQRPEIEPDAMPALHGPISHDQYREAMFMMMGMFLGLMNRKGISQDGPADEVTLVDSGVWKELEELAGALRGIHVMYRHGGHNHE